MRIEHIVPTLERPLVAARPTAKTLVPPPTLGVLPRRRAGAGVMFASVGLHAAAMAALIWLPQLFPTPVFIQVDALKPAATADFEPLVLPNLPQLEDRGSGSMTSAAGASGAGSGSASPAADPPPQKPDYSAPQEIVSFFPNAVNRVQTIRRPDLVAPPEMKFPVRLQNMVALPAAAPVLNTPAPREEPKPAPLPFTREEIPVEQATVQDAALTLTPKRLLPEPAEPTPPKAAEPIPKELAESQPAPPKAAVVINAVNVPADPTPKIPDAQLAGNFVVGPSPAKPPTEKSAAAGTGRTSESSAPKGVEGSSGPGLDTGTAKGAGSGHETGGSGGDRAESGTGAGSATPGGRGSASGSGSGTALGSGGKSGAGEGLGAGSTRGSGSGSGGPGYSAGNGNSTGISISGGVPGRNSATINRAIPTHRSYGMMIISGGGNGGASRDVGVFDRSETVYSVTIPMADAGGGPDWTMQYALANRTQAGAGLVVPPFAQKKMAATMPKSQLGGESGPVFISGTIDENGKLQSLRSIRAQDARSQSAIHTLQQWEFLPAQLDGNPVASKVLIGVTVAATD